MILRDGAHTSLWQNTVNQFIPTSRATLNETYDVIVVGAGITGITTALELQRSGKKCLVLEANTVCYGTTAGTTAHLNTLLDTPYTTLINNFDLESAARVASAADDALQHIVRNVVSHSIACNYEAAQAYLFAQDEKEAEELGKIYHACRQVGLDAEEVKFVPISRKFVRAILVSGQGKFHPLRYVFALAEAFEKAGGTIKQYCRVESIEEEKQHVRVRTTDGSFSAEHVIYCTHIPPGINLLHMRCAPYRSYAMAVTLRSGVYPPDLIYDMEDPYHYYRTQNIDGTNYLIVGGQDHKTGHEPNTDGCFRQLESHVNRYFDVEAVMHKWSSQYYEPADGLPYIGVLPGHSERVLVATGFGGNGMIYGTVASEVFKSIIFEEQSDLVSLFAPSRIKPVAGFRNFVDHNSDVLKQLISKLFAKDGFNGFADLAPGEGKVIDQDGEAIGVYKDELGAVHTVNATCTHMKCRVEWNLTERSWDCPCHGARYSMNGEVLNGPATRDLEYINLELVNVAQSVE